MICKLLLCLCSAYIYADARSANEIKNEIINLKSTIFKIHSLYRMEQLKPNIEKALKNSQGETMKQIMNKQLKELNEKITKAKELKPQLTQLQAHLIKLQKALPQC